MAGKDGARSFTRAGGLLGIALGLAALGVLTREGQPLPEVLATGAVVAVLAFWIFTRVSAKRPKDM